MYAFINRLHYKTCKKSVQLNERLLKHFSNKLYTIVFQLNTAHTVVIL